MFILYYSTWSTIAIAIWPDLPKMQFLNHAIKNLPTVIPLLRLCTRMVKVHMNYNEMFILYFLEISLWQDFISKPCLMRWQFEGGVHRDQHACVYSASIMSLFVCIYNACVQMYIIVDPVPCGEILRAVFIGMSRLKYAARAAEFWGVARFRGNMVFLCCVHVLYLSTDK